MSADGPRLERLRSDHDVSAFARGVEELDQWLVRHALAAQQMDSARTFVVVRRERVVGYVSLTIGSVRRADAPARLVRGLPAYPIGVVLIAWLAIDTREQRTGLGTRLLADALRLAVIAGESAAARLVAVDAIDQSAADFYRHHGFTDTLDHPLRLYRRVKDTRASLEDQIGEQQRLGAGERRGRTRRHLRWVAGEMPDQDVGVEERCLGRRSARWVRVRRTISSQGVPRLAAGTGTGTVPAGWDAYSRV